MNTLDELAPTRTELRELGAVLRSRPGRGGVRLSYRQAAIALALVERASHVLRRRFLIEWDAHELVAAGGDLDDITPVHVVELDGASA